MANLPDKVERHHHLRIKEEYDPVIKFCVKELLVPVGHLMFVSRVPDHDQYKIMVRSGYSFIVSAQDIAMWENDPKCVPER